MNSLVYSRKGVNFASQMRDKPTHPSNILYAMIPELRTQSPEMLKAFGEKFMNYRSVIFRDPSSEDTPQWLEFMSECMQSALFALYALNILCDSIMGANTPLHNNVVLFNTTNMDCGGLALGYQTSAGTISGWPLVEYGIDTWSWDMLVKDTENGKEYRIPLNRLSTWSILNTIATMRQGLTVNDLTYTHI